MVCVALMMQNQTWISSLSLLAIQQAMMLYGQRETFSFMILLLTMWPVWEADSVLELRVGWGEVGGSLQVMPAARGVIPA